ncbi:hypothetical protein [Actinomadura parmotrematis]|uniref:Uncharacterized protein n=1 Tax=Actinomadura parmotrematis TaxID=2864039 RepID=A0ABS7FUD5_9ACTN|nr:hypothetical protein [Actinomadura parmotrematis]MBW8484009.1 hypothetical protein [Actinomadura parmotrematis]
MSQWDSGALSRLRAAAYHRDGAAAVALLRDRPLGPVLQYAGDVLVAAVEAGTEGAAGLARKALVELDGRGEPGDVELAAEVAAALGCPRRDALPGLAVDLTALAVALGQEIGSAPWILDLERGDLLEPDEPLEDGGLGDVRERYVAVPALGPEPGGEEAARGRARRWLAGLGLRAVSRSL